MVMLKVYGLAMHAASEPRAGELEHPQEEGRPRRPFLLASVLALTLVLLLHRRCNSPGQRSSIKTWLSWSACSREAGGARWCGGCRAKLEMIMRMKPDPQNLATYVRLLHRFEGHQSFVHVSVSVCAGWPLPQQRHCNHPAHACMYTCM